MPFQFIDNTAIDRRSRKLIRSHVMQGRNKGKTLTRPARTRRKVTPVTPDTESPDSNGDSVVVEQAVVEHTSSPAHILLASPIGHRFASVRLPAEPGPYARRVLTQFLQLVELSLYPPEFCYLPDHATSVYFQYMAEDACFLHCSVALSVAFVDVFLGNQQMATRSPEALTHIAHAFRLTSQKLSSGAALDDHTMASVVSLGLHEQLATNYATGRIHLEGLVKMVGLRGGLLQLPRELAQKICRCDIDVALHDGTPPLLHYPGIPGDQVHAVFGSKRKPSRLADLRFKAPDAVLDGIATDVNTVADFLDSDTRRHKLQPVTYQDLNMDILYRLLDHRSFLVSESSDSLQTALHLTLLAFMTTFVLQFGHQRSIHFNNLSQRLIEALQGPWTLEPENRAFLMWALVVSGISEFGPSDHIWLLPAIRRAATELDIHDWEGLQAALVQYPWVRVLHNSSAKALWDSASGI